MKRIIGSLMSAGLLAVATANALAGNWTNFSNFNQVTAVAERGNEVWVAAKGGLVKYDRTTGDKTFFHKAPGELPSLSVEKVVVHPLTNDIWIGTYDNGLAFWHNNTWTHLPLPIREATLYDLKIAPNGDVWAATSRALYCYKNNQFYTYLEVPSFSTAPCWGLDITPGGKLICAHFTPFLFDPTTSQSVDISCSVFAYSNSAVYVKDDSTFYFSSDHGSLIEYHDTTEVDSVELAGMIKGMAFTAAGTRLVTEDNHLYELNGSGVNELALDSGFAAALLHSTDGWWIGSNKNTASLVHQDNQGQVSEVSFQKAELKDNSIRFMTGTEDGNILVTTYSSIQKFDKATQSFTEEWSAGASYLNFWEAIELHGKIYAGSNYNYLYEFTSSDSFTVLGSGILPSSQVLHLSKDAAGNLWMCGPRYIASYNGSQFTVYDSAHYPQLAGNYMLRDIYCDTTRNIVWAASYSGIYKLQNGNLTFYDDNTPGIQQYYDVINTIAEDPQHNIWFGTAYGGLVKYDGSSFSTMLLPETAGNQLVTSIAFDGNTLYLGDNIHGVMKYESMQWDSFTLYNSPLTSSFNSCLYFDGDNNLWIGNYTYGLDVYNKNGLTLGAPETASPRAALRAYPNPSQGVFRLDFDSDEQAEVAVFTLQGRLVQQIPASGRGAIVDLHDQPKGLYLCQLRSANKAETIRLLIQ